MSLRAITRRVALCAVTLPKLGITTKGDTMDSSWIENVSRDDTTGVVTMTTASGNAYEIMGMTDSNFESWSNEPSGGSYFNTAVRGKHDIVRATNN